jgi:hypothetical protein
MKTDRIETILRIQVHIIFDSRTEFSNRIQIQIVYFVSNSDIHRIWIIGIQL